MKRTYPYTGPGSAPSAASAASAAYGQPQPPQPAGPAPPLPAGPVPNAGQTQAYANYGYGQVAPGRVAGAVTAVIHGAAGPGAYPAAGLTATDAQQAQWHQQWQQYYAQQAVASASHQQQPQQKQAPPQPQQAGPQQPTAYVPGRVGPSPQASHAQPYAGYPQPQQPQHPQHNVYQYPSSQQAQQQQQQPAPVTQQDLQQQQHWQPPTAQLSQQAPMHQQHQSPLPAAMQQAAGGYYGNPQGGPPAKRTRYDQPQNTLSSYSAGGMQSQQGGSRPYGPGLPGGAHSPPSMAAGPAAPVGPAQSFGWQAALGAGSAGGPGPGMGGASPMRAAGIGSGGAPVSGGGTPSRGGRGGGGVGGVGSFPNVPGHVGSPMSQGGSSGGPQAFRGPGRGGSNGVQVGPGSGRPMSEASGWGARGGRAGAGGPTGSAHSTRAGANGPNMTGPGAGRRGSSMSADRGGRAGAGGGGSSNMARNAGSHSGSGRGGFSSQNSIPINAPNGPASSRMGRDASKHSSVRGGHHGNCSGSTGAGPGAGGGAVGRAAAGSSSTSGAFEQKQRLPRSAASAAESVQGSSNSKRSLISDFRIRALEINAIDWSWSVDDVVADADDKNTDAEDTADDTEEAATEAGGDADADAGDDAEQKKQAAVDDVTASPSEDGKSAPTAPSPSIDPPKGPRAGTKKASLEARTARVRATIAATVRDSTRLRITFGTPVNAGPEGAPTGPKADKNKAAVAAGSAPTKKHQGGGGGGAVKGQRNGSKEAARETPSASEAKTEPAAAAEGATSGAASEVEATCEVSASVDVDTSAAMAEGKIEVSGEQKMQDGAKAEAAEETEETTIGADKTGLETEAVEAQQQKEATTASADAGVQKEEADEGVPPAEQQPENEADGRGKSEGWTPVSKGPPQCSVNRVTISFAGSRRRLVIDADAIKSLFVNRAAGRIEIVVRIVTCPTSVPADATAKKDKKRPEWVVCKGVLLESRGQGQSSYMALARHQIEELWKSGSGQSQSTREPKSTAKGTAVEGEEDDAPKADAEGDKDKTDESASVKVEEETTAQAGGEKGGPPIDDLGPRSEIPPFYRLLPLHDGPADERDHAASKVEEMTIVAHLDRDSPLAEPPWVKTGDVDVFLTQLPTYSQRPHEQTWHDKIHVVDPDPPPTIDTLLEEWCAESFLDSARERRRWMSETVSSVYQQQHYHHRSAAEGEMRSDELEAQNRVRIKGLVEILARMVRGDRGPSAVLSTLSGPLAAAFKGSSSTSQNYSSLSVLAIFDMALRFSEVAKADSQEMRKGVGEMLMQFPKPLFFKTLDALWKERIERTRNSSALSGGAGQKRKRDKEGGSNKRRSVSTVPVERAESKASDDKAAAAAAAAVKEEETQLGDAAAAAGAKADAASKASATEVPAPADTAAAAAVADTPADAPSTATVDVGVKREAAGGDGDVWMVSNDA